MKDEIILNNLGLIHKAIKDLHCEYRTKEQFEQYYYAGLFGLILASKTYDKAKGNSVYLYNSISARIRSAFKYNTSLKRNNGLVETSLNGIVKETNEEYIEFLRDSYNLEEDVITRLTVRDALNKLKNKKYKQFIIEYYGIDCPALNMQELALKYGVSKQNIQQTIQWGLRLLRKEIK